WPPSVWFAIMRRRSVKFAAAVVSAPIKTWPTAPWKFVVGVSESLRGRSMRAQKDSLCLPRFLNAAPAGVLKVAASALIASARYRPGYYPGELTLFNPAERDPALPSLEAIWRQHARALSIIDTAGDHLSMFAAAHA